MADLATLPEVKAFLNITNGNSDTSIQSMLSASSDMITNRIGPVGGSPTFSEWYDGGGPKIVLRHAPVQSIVKITEAWGATMIYTLNASVLDGTPTDMGQWGYSVDLGAGIITRRAAGYATPFARGVQNINVQYVAGYATVPEELKLATKLLVQHMWATQRGGSKRPGLGGDDSGPSNDFDAFPSRVEEILANFYTPGIA
jgi:uncharacterized phiE125 gp8 family phage protein